jgi:hypothetical protein
MATCTICGNDVGPITVGRQADLCADCQYKTEKTPSALIPEVSAEPSAFVARFGLTKILVGLNIEVFVGMVATGVSPLNPTMADLVRWGADWGPRPWAHSPGDC